jgi:hypothetical protein
MAMGGAPRGASVMVDGRRVALSPASIKAPADPKGPAK